VKDRRVKDRRVKDRRVKDRRVKDRRVKDRRVKDLDRGDQVLDRGEAAAADGLPGANGERRPPPCSATTPTWA
jgi:hypothetical protein